MQLILDTENHSVNEKMSTPNSETVLENTLSNGDLKEIGEEINRKPESNGTSDKENVESRDNNVSKSDKFENHDGAGDIATDEKPKEALKQIQECVPTEVSTLAVEKENEQDKIKENLVLNAEIPLDLDDKENTQAGEKENLKFDGKESPLPKDVEQLDSEDKEIQLNETNNPKVNQKENLDQDETKNVEQDETENLELEKTEKLELFQTEILKLNVAEELELETPQNIESMESENLKLDDMEKLEFDETETHESHKNKSLVPNVEEMLHTVETKTLELDKTEKKELDNLKDLELNKTVEPKNAETGELICTKEMLAEKPSLAEHIPADINLSKEAIHITRECDNITEKADKITPVEEKADEMEVDEGNIFNIDQELEDSSEKHGNQSISVMVENIVQNLSDDAEDDLMDGIEEENNSNKIEAQLNIIQKIHDENVNCKLSDQDNKDQNISEATEVKTSLNCPKEKDVGDTKITHVDDFKEIESSIQTETIASIEKEENVMEIDEENNLNAMTKIADNKDQNISEATEVKTSLNCPKEKDVRDTKITHVDDFKEIESSVQTETIASIEKEENVMEIDEENNLNAMTKIAEPTKSADITPTSPQRACSSAFSDINIIQDTGTPAKIKDPENTEKVCVENNKKVDSEELKGGIISDTKLNTSVEEDNGLSLKSNGDNIATSTVKELKNKIDEAVSMESCSGVVELKSGDSSVNNLEDSESSITKVEDNIVSCMSSDIEEAIETSRDIVISEKLDKHSADRINTKEEEVKLVEVVNSVSEQKATDNTSKIIVYELSDKQSVIPNAKLSEKNNDISHVEKVKLVVDSENVTEQARNEKTPEKVTPLIKLSNTMDILSDEEEEQLSVEPPKKVTETSEKQCINLDDDDDIMLIDDDTSKDEKKENQDTEDASEKVEETKNKNNSETDVVDPKNTENKIPDASESKMVSTNPEMNVKDVLSPQPEPEKSPDTMSEKPEKSRSLIPGDLFKSYRKNLADMTRDDLEEFCILKIVESIIDRSNINEIRSKLKSMGQTIEEYKKKAMMLTKQNRDLQVVLKSVQEEQKKSNGTQPITPLKITRSVGMQVLMTDKNRRRVMPGPVPGTGQTLPIVVNNANQTNTRTTMRNTIPNQRNTPQKQVNNHTNIPVPRLVPAGPNVVNKATVATPATPINNTVKVTTVQNGVKNISPAQKPEKRTHNRMQSQSSSVTVDLTDDEPPSKIATKSTPAAPPVRLVNQQNLIAPRQQFTQQVNSPRKVYIPISINGPQPRNVSPGQTIMLKTVSAQGPRPRGPAPAIVRPPQSVQVRRLGGTRHPAPLPDAMKQYQPPNWKALPPAPDLKLSKVENGIVISWKIEGYQEDSYEEIASYQLYAYQETSAPPSTALWKKIGDVKALPLPMACTLTQFMAGYKYYFAVRAVDIRSRFGPFSLPGSILLLNKM